MLMVSGRPSTRWRLVVKLLNFCVFALVTTECLAEPAAGGGRRRRLPDPPPATQSKVPDPPPIASAAPVQDVPKALEAYGDAVNDFSQKGGDAAVRGRVNAATTRLMDVNSAINKAAASGDYDNKDFDKLKAAMALSLMMQTQLKPNSGSSGGSNSGRSPRQSISNSAANNPPEANAPPIAPVVPNISPSENGTAGGGSNISAELARELAGSRVPPPIPSGERDRIQLDESQTGNFNTPFAAVEYVKNVFAVSSDSGPAATIGKDIAKELTKGIEKKADGFPQETSAAGSSARGGSDTVKLDEHTTAAIGALAIAALVKAQEDGTLKGTVRDTLDNFVNEAKKSGKKDPLAEAVVAAKSDPAVYESLVGDLTNAIFKNAKADISQRFSVTGRVAGLAGSDRPGAFGKRTADRTGLRALLPGGGEADVDGRSPASATDEASLKLPGGVPWLVAAVLGAFVLYCIYVLRFTGRSREAAAPPPPSDDQHS